MSLNLDLTTVWLIIAAYFERPDAVSILLVSTSHFTAIHFRHRKTSSLLTATNDWENIPAPDDDQMTL